MERKASQKTRERHSFDSVYGNEILADVVEHECPDFLARHFTDSPWFGVEITELYETETNARLVYLPDYGEHLLSGGEFVHKDDSGVLDVVRVRIESRDGEPVASDVPAIIQEVSHPSEHAQLIAGRINAKNRVVRDAPSSLSHTNLIIHDKSRRFQNTPADSFYRTAFVPEMRAALSDTRFREVYLVGFVDNQEVYVPLKMIHLLAEAHLFSGALFDSSRADSIPSDVDFIELFGSYLNDMVQPDVLLSRGADGPEVLFGNASIRIEGRESLIVSIYADHPVPPDASSPDPIWERLLGKRFHEVLSDYRKNHAFSTNAVHPVCRRNVQE